MGAKVLGSAWLTKSLYPGTEGEGKQVWALKKLGMNSDKHVEGTV